jgi:hypothetical protein
VALPEPIRRVARQAMAGTVEDLIAAGIVPSAEVLAELVPRIAATVIAASYPDTALRALMAAHYCAFRNRRSLLLLNLEHQVRIDELPWVAALAAVRQANSSTDARAALVRVGRLTLDTFPATVLPNPLINELTALAREAGLDLPWVEELAADIFMGTFTRKFARAAQFAARLLDGSLYARYYGIDYAAIRALDVTGSDPTSQAFAAICRDRAGAGVARHSVAANGTVIEQAQILTTHNLALLAGSLRVVPVDSWAGLSRRSFQTVAQLMRQAAAESRPLRTIKDAAYAWRQTVFYLSLAEPAGQTAFVEWARELVAGHPGTALPSIVDGLAQVVAGGAPERGPFLGWSTGQRSSGSG